MKKTTHIDTYKKVAKELGLNIKTLKQGGNFSSSLVITDNKKIFFVAPKETGFYPETTRPFTVLANSKMLTEQVLNQFGYKTVKSVLVDCKITTTDEELTKKINRIKKYPTLIKPENGNKGKGIVIANNQAELTKKAKNLWKKDINFMMQEIVYGTEYRILMVSGKIYAMHAKEFPFVEGDGKRNLKQIIKEDATFSIDKNFLSSFLQKENITNRSVLPDGFKVPYNITRKGSYSYYETKKIPKETKKWVKDLAKLLNTTTIGLDVFLPEDKSQTNDYRIIEINASPGFVYLGERYKDKELVKTICQDVLKNYFKL